MSPQIYNIVMAAILVYCQVNFYAMVVVSKYTLKKTLIFCNVLTTVLVLIYMAEVLTLGIDRAANSMFLTFTIPSIFVEGWVSKNKGSRFWFTFLFCDFSISSVGFAVDSLAGTLGVAAYSFERFLMEFCAIIIAAATMITFMRKPIKRVVQEKQMGFTNMALFVFALEALMYFVSSYPTSIVERQEDCVLCFVILVIELFVAVIYIDNINKFQTAIQKRMEAVNVAQENKQRFLFMNQRYRVLEDNINKIKQIKHDIQHQLRIINTYMQQGKNEEGIEYISSIANTVEDIEITEYCSCKVVNITVAWFERLAQNEGINFSFEGNIPDVDEKYYSMLTSVTSNILQNALEACEYLVGSNESPYIAMECNVKGSALHIQCRNNFDGHITESDGKIYSKKQEEGHGIGLHSIRASVENYNGYMKYKTVDDEFIIDVALVGIINE